VLRLETLYFADEIRSPARELPELPGDVDLSDREISMAQLLLESMQSEWSPDKYHDTHRQKVEALIDEKRQGHQVVVQASSETAPPQVVDLMEVLSASIDSVAARRRSTADTPTGTTGTRHPAAKKPVKSVKSVKANKAPAAKAPAAKKSAPRQPARRKAS
jgi:DNA end-binding protein Ku